MQVGSEGFHLGDARFLGCDDGLQDGDQFRADVKLQGGGGHFHGAHVVRNHLPQEVAVHPPGGLGPAHPDKHGVHNGVHALLVAAHCFRRVFQPGAGTENGFHIFDAFGLLCNDLRCDFPQGFILRIVKNVLGHFNGGPMVGDHLDHEVVRDAAVQCGAGHSCDHPIQNAAVGLQVFLGIWVWRTKFMHMWSPPPHTM